MASPKAADLIKAQVATNKDIKAQADARLASKSANQKFAAATEAATNVRSKKAAVSQSNPPLKRAVRGIKTAGLLAAAPFLWVASKLPVIKHVPFLKPIAAIAGLFGLKSFHKGHKAKVETRELRQEARVAVGENKEANLELPHDRAALQAARETMAAADAAADRAWSQASRPAPALEQQLPTPPVG